ncbi:glycosyltransferase [Treponema sp.]|uniref:glycosyltransferase n=1 Tax=Treponema sp. TaxID=166 RepID=UPI003FD86D8C
MNKIAVLLAAYNGSKWIEEQINSILNQQRVNVTIYVSCDLSTDNTLEILNKYDEKVILLPYGSKFGAAAPNFYRLIKDVDFSTFDYIALSDQDDIWLPTKLIEGVNKIQKTNSAGYSSNVTAFWDNGIKRTVVKATPQKKYDFLFESPGPGCSFVITKDLAIDFKNKLILKESLLKKLDWHDWLIYAFARSNGYKWYIDKKSYMLYRQHASNQLGANSGLKQFNKRVNDIISGYGINQTVCTIKFCDMENNSFVRKWYMKGRKGYLYLMTHSKLCRRRRKDTFLFWISCLIMAIKNIKMEDR